MNPLPIGSDFFLSWFPSLCNSQFCLRNEWSGHNGPCGVNCTHAKQSLFCNHFKSSAHLLLLPQWYRNWMSFESSVVRIFNLFSRCNLGSFFFFFDFSRSNRFQYVRNDNVQRQIFWNIFGQTVCSWTRMLTDENSHLHKSFLHCDTLAALNSIPSQWWKMRQCNVIQSTRREHEPPNRFSNMEKRNGRIRDKRVWIFQGNWSLSLSRARTHALRRCMCAPEKDCA